MLNFKDFEARFEKFVSSYQGSPDKAISLLLEASKECKNLPIHQFARYSKRTIAQINEFEDTPYAAPEGLEAACKFVDQNEALREMKEVQFLAEDCPLFVAKSLGVEQVELSLELPDLPIPEAMYVAPTKEDMYKDVEAFLSRLENPPVEEVENKKALELKSLKDRLKTKNIIAKVNDDGSVSPKFEMSIKSFEKGKNARTPKDYEPTDEELAQINAISKIDLEKHDVVVFTLQSADQNVDRQYEHFTSQALKSMAEKSVNKPILLDHYASTRSQVGKIFSASVAKQALMQKAYFPKTDRNLGIIEDIMNGLYDKLSVGFNMAWKDMICDSCGNSIISQKCAHYPGDKDEKGNVVTMTLKDVTDYYETSLVAIPAQPAAHIMNQLSVSELASKAKVFVGTFLGKNYTANIKTIETEINDENNLVDKITNGIETTIKDSASMSVTEAELKAKQEADEKVAAEAKALLEAKEKAEGEAKAKADAELAEAKAVEIEAAKKAEDEKVALKAAKQEAKEARQKAQDEVQKEILAALADLKKTIEVVSQVSTKSVREALFEDENQKDAPVAHPHANHWLGSIGQTLRENAGE